MVKTDEAEKAREILQDLNLAILGSILEKVTTIGRMKTSNSKTNKRCRWLFVFRKKGWGHKELS